MPETLAPEIQELLDKQAIKEVLLRYARGVDRCDREALASVFFPDAVVVRGDRETSAVDLPDRFLARAREIYDSCFHQVTNFLITIDGDRARSEAYVVAISTYHEGDREFQRSRGLRWIDQFERRAGEWRIVHRVAVGDWGRLEENDLAVPYIDELPQGTRSLDDPSYH
jgi:ketosteroid isomerase-like protein